MKSIITIADAVIAHPDHRLPKPVNLSIAEGEQLAIVGCNAAGKSKLVDMLTGQWPLRQGIQRYDFTGSRHKLVSRNVKYISFRDSYGEADGTYYLQQRWNQHDIDADTPTVGMMLQRAMDAARTKDADIDAWQQKIQEHLLKMFGLNEMRDKYIIALSSGEQRKFQLTRALLSAPRLLVMDNPFIGLDADARQQLKQLLVQLTTETPMQVVLVVSKVADIPDFVTHVVPVTPEGVVLPKRTWHSHDTDREALAEEAGMVARTDCLRPAQRTLLNELLNKSNTTATNAEEVMRLNKVSIRYGNRTILDSIEWTVRRGEHWLLLGSNGAGKSTLLSLVCADNPQGYACDITLFGRQRGTGESIWDIKHHIGYVSPEMHRAYMRDLPVIDIVASGLSDSIGLYHRPRPDERERCMQWLKVFGIDNLADRTFLRLSSGEQRLCLVARAFVKSPELLILDEPLHGLDERNTAMVKEVISAYCTQPGKTLIMVTHYPEQMRDLQKYNLQTYRLPSHNGTRR